MNHANTFLVGFAVTAVASVLAMGLLFAIHPPVSAPSTLLSSSFPEQTAKSDSLGSAGTGFHTPVEPAEVASSDPDDHFQGPVIDNSRASPAFSSESVKAFIKTHPNNPLKFTPATASQDQIAYLETETAAILSAWQRENDRLLIRHGDNLLALCSDPDVIANDKDRVTRLRNLVLSLWPNCGLE